MNKETLIPVILGIFLSSIGTGLSFVWSEIDDIKKTQQDHRVSLAQLITPDGVVISSPGSTERASLIKDRIAKLELEILTAGKDEFTNIHIQLQKLLLLEHRIEQLERKPQ
jgi:hypothetical protein